MELAGATVLVVDDEPIVNLTMSLLLERAGATVHCAENGAEALQLINTHAVDVMICDKNMPLMDGNALLKALHRAGKNVPTLFFVSGMNDEDTVALRAMGVRDLLVKPVQPKALLERVTAVLADLPRR